MAFPPQPSCRGSCESDWQYCCESLAVERRVRFFPLRVLSADRAMHELSDQELLRRYADHGADEAFAEVVRRHCNLFWAAARRVSGDGEIARDVAQTVFTDLWRKVGKLPDGTVLAGWLYRAACHAAANQIRGEARRAQREQQAMHQHELRDAEAAERRAAEELQPWLDAALADLTEADRDTSVRASVELMDQNGKANLRELRFALEEWEWKPAFTIERSPSGSLGATLVLPLTPELGPTKQ